MVKVKIYGTLALDLNESRIELKLTGNTLADVIDQMTAQYGSKVREELLDQEGSLDYAYGIFSDGERVNLGTRIQDGSELVIVNMLGGG